MSAPRNTEPQANGALARALIRRNPDWDHKTVSSERTHVIEGSVPGSGAGLQPDILIAAPRRQPVIVETEFYPAPTVEKDATARLGKRLHSTGEDIEGGLSVVLPESLKTGYLETVEMVNRNINENRTLAQCCDMPLPKLVSGEIRCHDADVAVETLP